MKLKSAIIVSTLISIMACFITLDANAGECKETLFDQGPCIAVTVNGNVAQNWQLEIGYMDNTGAAFVPLPATNQKVELQTNRPKDVTQIDEINLADAHAVYKIPSSEVGNCLSLKRISYYNPFTKTDVYANISLTGTVHQDGDNIPTLANIHCQITGWNHVVRPN